MRKAVRLCVFAGVLLSVVTAFARMQLGSVREEHASQSRERFGTVEGQVVTREGRPVANATVYAFQHGGSPLAFTNTEGKFALTNLSAGKHLIIAHKESDGYPNLVWTFYSEAYGNEGKLVVNVEANKTVQGATVQLGPKAGRLLIRVIDAKTRRAIRDVSLELNHKGKPNTRFEPGMTNLNGEFNTLIPPSRPINVVIKAPGYKTWRYVNRGSADRDALRLRPGASKEMTVELKQGIG